MNSDHVAEVRRALSDPIRVIERLGLSKDAQRQAGGAIVRCPHHRERTPSCSVTRGPDGTLRAKCFGCDWSADVLGLVAEVHGLDASTQFREVLGVAAELAGLWDVVEEVRGERVPSERRVAAPPPPADAPLPPAREYPDPEELNALWRAARRLSEDADVFEYLEGRVIDTAAADKKSLARVLTPTQALPSWARYKGPNPVARTWVETGHRIIIRAFDAHGVVRSVRAWRITRDDDSPKRLPPSGKLSTGLVMANAQAWELLAGKATPEELVIQEGEPDFMVAATRWDTAVLGIINGSWTPELAARVAQVKRVIVRTHNDQAGDKYAEAIVTSLRGKCELWRRCA